MRIITKGPLMDCWKKHPEAQSPLTIWYNVAKKSNWKNVNEIKETFPNVSILSNNRVVFNIKGNSYRLVVAIKFQMSTLFICWVGTHDDYNKIDANTVWDY